MDTDEIKEVLTVKPTVKEEGKIWEEDKPITVNTKLMKELDMKHPTEKEKEENKVKENMGKTTPIRIFKNNCKDFDEFEGSTISKRIAKSVEVNNDIKQERDTLLKEHNMLKIRYNALKQQPNDSAVNTGTEKIYKTITQNSIDFKKGFKQLISNQNVIGEMLSKNSINISKENLPQPIPVVVQKPIQQTTAIEEELPQPAPTHAFSTGTLINKIMVDGAANTKRKQRATGKCFQMST